MEPQENPAREFETPLVDRLFLQILGVAAAYAVMGKFGLLLALPPGYATAIWPSSGIALAAVLAYGFRVWPGVLLGSFLVNISTGFDASTLDTVLASLPVPLGIGAGAAAQAVAGAYLVRRFAGFPNSLSTEREVFSFLFWGGPISCLINAGIGVSVLLAAGIIPATNFLINAGTWWIGDTIGVFIFAPLVLVWALRPRELWRPRRASVTVPIALTFGLVVVAASFGADWERRQLATQFQKQATALATTLDKALTVHLETLRSLERFYAASTFVDRDEFRTFIAGSLSEQRGLHALEWAPLVDDRERAQFELDTKREGFPDFQITERTRDGVIVPSAHRPDYVAVHYLEPFDKNVRAFGFDLASDPTRRDALHSARDGGNPTASARIPLVQGTREEYGVLVIIPVYANGQPRETLDERRRNLTGYMVGVFRAGEIVNAAFRHLDHDGLVYHLVDETAPPDQQLLYSSDDTDAGIVSLDDEGVFGGSTRIGRSFTLDFGGRRWRIDVAPNQTYIAQNRPEYVWLILIAGMMMTSLVGGFVVTVSGRNIALLELVERRTEALRDASEAAQSASLAKSEFLASMSHEIRTPMSGVMGFADMLLEDDLPDASTQKVYKIKDATRALLRIIDDILDMSKLEAGKMDVENIDFHLPSEINQVLDLFEERRTGERAKSLELEVRLSDDFPEAIKSDPTRIRQILVNLVGNAVKFTESGSVTIEGTRVTSVGGQSFLRIAVRDTGIGMKPDTIDRLFSEFTQADASISRRFEGSGLGLSICKRLVALLGGKIGVESSYGTGSTFWFTIPHVPATTEVPTRVQAPAPAAHFTTTRPLDILVAEDNLLNQQILAATLASMGHASTLAENGAEAVEKHQSGRFDLILMDVRMPEMSGPDATRAIRLMADDKSRVPIIAVTADAMAANRVEFFEAGMDEVTTKPIDRALLAEAINKVMGEAIHVAADVTDTQPPPQAATS